MLINFFFFSPAIIQWTLKFQVHQKHLQSPLSRLSESVSPEQPKEFPFLITLGHADGARTTV